MKGGLTEILESGHAPGYAAGALDPSSADAAIPRALKEVERTKNASDIVREMGWKPTKRNLDAIKKCWSI